MDLSVIIVNYNVRQFLENALTSIARAMEGLQGEVIVVDNASDDGSVEMVQAKFPRVILIENQRNHGFARANNMALQRARGDFILLINPDTIVQEDTFHMMLKFFRETPDAGLAGCKILNPDGSFQLACRRSFPTPWVALTKILGVSALFPRSRAFGKYNLTYLSPDETYEVDAVSGSFMMVRREAYERVGGLDEAFFMYGEDLDWCYRIGEAGFKVYYVHATKIIHFKGESTRRSDIDELRLFYQAMQLFVEKHFSSSFVVELFLTIGITLRAALAFLGRMGRPFLMALVDALLVTGALIAAEFLYFGHLFRFPGYAYPVVWTVPALTVVLALYLNGQYTTNRFSLVRASAALLISYVIISATVFFAKNFAFSRAVVIISGLIALLLIPGWRLAYRKLSRGSAHSGTRKSLFGRRTLIVGTGPSALAVLKKLRARVDDGYDVLGFVSTQRRQIGEKISGLEIIGSLDNVGKVISEWKVGEVIFSTESVTYTDILSVISRSKDWGVNFRLVPTSLEAIIGKTRIDELDTLPLVEIEYNVHKPVNRMIKRLFDVLVSLVLLVTMYPWAWVRRNRRTERGPNLVLLLPRVVRGALSLVGRPLSDPDKETAENPVVVKDGSAFLGPRGLTGLVQINEREGLEQDEREKYKLYYAKNQSLILDVEIMLKALLLRLKQRKGASHG